MTKVDQIALALVMWKENRDHGLQAMQAVGNVVLNRAKSRKQTIYQVVYDPFQFSSMSYQHDPQLLIQPDEDDSMWISAQNLATLAANGALTDVTMGSTSYYALSMKTPPAWAKLMTHTVTLGNQVFFK